MSPVSFDIDDGELDATVVAGSNTDDDGVDADEERAPEAASESTSEDTADRWTRLWGSVRGDDA